MTRSRIFLYILLGCIFGVALQSFFSLPIEVIWALFIFACVLCGIGGQSRKRVLVVCGLVLIAATAGMVRFRIYERGQLSLSSLDGREVRLRGVVDKEPYRAGVAQVSTFRVTAINDSVIPASYLQIKLRAIPEFHLGDELMLAGKIHADEKDPYITTLRRKGISGSLLFPRAEKIGEGKASLIMRKLTRLRLGFDESIDRILAEPYAGFLKGLLLGERAEIAPDLARDLATTGTNHIIALSGYNITIVGRNVSRLLMALTVPIVASFWVSCGAIVAFVLLTGASASLVRAAIMGILLLIAQREGRMYHAANALALTGVAMLMQNPSLVRFDISFQLSFLATIGIVYVSPVLGTLLDRAGRRVFAKNQIADDSKQETGVLAQLKSIFTETISAQIMVLPLLVLIFHRISLISPLANLAVLIAVPHAMGIGFAAAVLGLFWVSAGRVIGFATWLLLAYMLHIIRLFAAVPLASWEVGAAGAAIIACIGSAAGAWLLFYVRRKRFETIR